MKQFYEGARAGDIHVDRSTSRAPRDMMHSTWQEAVLRGTKGAGGIAQDKKQFYEGHSTWHF